MNLYFLTRLRGYSTNVPLCNSDCFWGIQSFFLETKLSCNPSKTEIVHLYSRFSNHTPIYSLNINQQCILISKEAHNLGVTFDKHLTMSIVNITNLCSTASLALRNLGRVRKYLDKSSTERLVHAFITSNCVKEIAFHGPLKTMLTSALTKFKIQNSITLVGIVVSTQNFWQKLTTTTYKTC